MLNVINVSLRFGARKLFEDVNIKFMPGNCYGVIGANGAGKSTFLKILSGEIESDTGQIITDPGERIAVLKQDHFEFDEEKVLQTVIIGHTELCEISAKKDAIYSKPDFSEEDGMIAAELEERFDELNGWDAESNAATILTGLGIPRELHDKKMKELTGSEKVKVLLAQAIFGNPDILLLDEPTNHLDIKSISWLENFLLDFKNTLIVVSHDRHFLNKICTHMADIDYGKIKLYVGNYDFWYKSSQLALQLAKNQNKKKEEKAKELREFIARFSSNASKAKQATSRKKQLEKLTLEDIQPSSRKFPYVGFTQDREAGNNLLKVENLSKTIDGVKVLNNVSFTIETNDKVIFLSENEIAKTTLFKILAGELEPDEGSYTWGVTTSRSYFPKDNSKYFEDKDLNLLDWLRQFSGNEQTETFLRSFLGRMLFTGDEVKKKVNVLSGGEKVRCMLAKMMIKNANVLLLDEPNNHLDLESITALNNGLIAFPGTILLIGHDHQFIETICNRVIEIKKEGVTNQEIEFDEYLNKK
ncbi:ABC-F family ATP-binding cassette domain-containing protein [Haliovirga abyssi]|uniref:ABC transporter ATP-binding protein n=1 Tax=Haliovirga abyssi TaxID=2996794 RepID=A0AAU9E0Z3_9FUSO|nr:ATP-binding cassette domain-containing protein [Haliovirga abyssi]BDU51605.1 ABC transporter ATP-binding protein [Haliovirga abyssi]